MEKQIQSLNVDKNEVELKKKNSEIQKLRNSNDIQERELKA